MADLFDEVEEVIRRDRLLALWRRTRTPFIAGVVVLALAMSVAAVWRSWRAEQMLDDAQRYEAALAAGAAGAADLATLADKGGGGYALLARLRDAALAEERGDRTAAEALYDRLAADAQVPAPYRDLALLFAVMAQAETGDPEALLTRLAPQLENDRAPWRFSACETAAALALRKGDVPRAEVLLRRLVDDQDAPPSLRQRARRVLQTLGVEIQ